MTLPQVTTLKSPAFRRISIRKMRTLGISLTDNADPLEAATRVNAQKAESKLRISALRCITVQESAATNSRCTRLSNLPLGGLPALPAQKRVEMGRGDDAHDARQSSSPALCFGWDGGPCHAGRRPPSGTRLTADTTEVWFRYTVIPFSETKHGDLGA